MASQSLEQRVQTLEHHVETLKTLPDRVGKLEFASFAPDFLLFASRSTSCGRRC